MVSSRKFIADSMLGRLARWLRLLGYDTLYYAAIEDSLLLRIAREDQRIVLTRDTRLVQVRGVENFLLLTANDPFKQLKHVITEFNLAPFGQPRKTINTLLPGRCSLCNTVLEDVEKEAARAHVPEYVYLTTEKFKKCAACNKLYWPGTHQKKLQEKLMEIL